MRTLFKRRRGIAVLLLTALLMQWPHAPLQPAVAHAEPSADPDEEIVYIDDAGIIRVFDTRVTGGNPEVKWVSPDGNWRDFALGDVNNDGDMEIVAIGGGSTDGKLAVFDPVVASGAVDPDQKINGIPWDTLYRVDLPGSPQLVVTGNFDQNLPGAEIIYLYQLLPGDRDNPDDRMRLIALKSDSPTPSGRGWAEHFRLNFTEEWEGIAAGNLDGESTDEFSLVSEESANLKVFRVDGGPKRIYEYGSSSRSPKAVAIGEWEGNQPDYLAWTRGSDPPLPAFYVQSWQDDDEFDDEYSEAFEPGPRAIFYAQINSSDDTEVVMLRTVSGGLKSARMIVRGRKQSDIPSELEQRLDEDNGYNAGAGGDIDGDGRDEIVLIRDDKMLVFYEAERSANSNSYPFRTNRRSIAIGDLDAIGFIFGPQFGVDRTQIDAVLEAGGQPFNTLFTLTNTTTNDPIPFTINVVGAPSWLSVQPLSGFTPSQVFLAFNTNNIQAGEYRTELQITSSDPTVINQPVTIDIMLRVTAALVSVQPASLTISYPCTDTATIRPRTLAIGGTPGIRYTAAIARSPDVAAAMAGLDGPLYNGYISSAGELVLRDGSGNEAALAELGDLATASGVNSEWPSAVSWLSARSADDIIPDTITLQATSLISESVSYDEVLLVIIADSRAGAPPGNVRLVPIAALCASDQLFLTPIGQGQLPAAD